MNLDIDLDIRPLQRAISTLQEALAAYKNDPDNSMIRDSVIKRFEYTYETSIKTLKRYLSQTSINMEVRDNSIATPLQNLIRESHAQGLLSGGWPVWHEYRNMRNRTAHTYDEAIAIAMIHSISNFVGEVEYLVEKLQYVLSRRERNDT